jgi:hypothetical protein
VYLTVTQVDLSDGLTRADHPRDLAEVQPAERHDMPVRRTHMPAHRIPEPHRATRHSARP